MDKNTFHQKLIQWGIALCPNSVWTIEDNDAGSKMVKVNCKMIAANESILISITSSTSENDESVKKVAGLMNDSLYDVQGRFHKIIYGE